MAYIHSDDEAKFSKQLWNTLFLVAFILTLLALGLMLGGYAGKISQLAHPWVAPIVVIVLSAIAALMHSFAADNYRYSLTGDPLYNDGDTPKWMFTSAIVTWVILLCTIVGYLFAVGWRIKEWVAVMFF